MDEWEAEANSSEERGRRVEDDEGRMSEDQEERLRESLSGLKKENEAVVS